MCFYCVDLASSVGTFFGNSLMDIAFFISYICPVPSELLGIFSDHTTCPLKTLSLLYYLIFPEANMATG